MWTTRMARKYAEHSDRNRTGVGLCLGFVSAAIVFAISFSNIIEDGSTHIATGVLVPLGISVIHIVLSRDRKTIGVIWVFGGALVGWLANGWLCRG